MPKIKAYKGNGAVIPIADAKIATAFRCPWTSKIFSNKHSYVKHLTALREDRIHRNIRARIRRKVFEELINQDSFERVIEWIETHPEFFFDRAIERGRAGWSERRDHLRDKFWIKMTFLDVAWSDSVSNSHSCPRGGVTCWSSREAEDGRPRGYPGWQGRIEFQLSHDLGFGSDLFRNIGIHTGTGGGISGHRYGYDVKFFAADWPALATNLAVERLGGASGIRSFHHGKPNYYGN